MSFSLDCKKELSNQSVKNTCCELAILSGIIKTTAVIKKQEKDFEIIIRTDIFEIYQILNSIMESVYGISLNIEISDNPKYFNEYHYEIIINKKWSRQILDDCKIIDKNENSHSAINESFDPYFLSDKCCQISYIKGVFLGCSTNNIVMSHKNKKNELKIMSGYMLQFRLSSQRFAEDLLNLLKKLQINAKILKRKKNYLVYIKSGENILDLLALINIKKCYMDLQNEMIYRGIRNNANRQNNCTSGNVSKTIKSSLKQLEEIQKIESTIGLNALDYKLQEAAMLRIANNEESLEDLAKLTGHKITKSGLNHRFRRITKIANELKYKEI